MPAEPHEGDSPLLANLAPGGERVRCTQCGFRWFGVIAAHGLAVHGSCTRCGGSLEFLEEHAKSDGERLDRVAQAAELQPWEVLGTPVSWD